MSEGDINFKSQEYNADEIPFSRIFILANDFSLSLNQYLSEEYRGRGIEDIDYAWDPFFSITFERGRRKFKLVYGSSLFPDKRILQFFYKGRDVSLAPPIRRK